MVSGSPIVAFLERAAQLRQQGQTGAAKEQMDLSGPQMGQPHFDAAHSLSSPDISGSSDNVPPSSKHRLHNVLPIAKRAAIVYWMKKNVTDNGNKHIASRTVREFPQHFRGTVNANLTRAKRLWSARDDYSNQDGGMTTQGMTTSITRVTRTGPKRSCLKARVGRGRKRQAWVGALHIELREEFDRLQKVGVKFKQH